MARLKILRWFVRLFWVLLWLAVAALLLEVYGAWRLRANDATARAWPPGERPGANRELDQEVIERYVGTLPPVDADLQARREFAEWVEAEREAFARAQHQLVAWCGADGTVERVYRDESHPQLRELAGRLEPGQPIWTVFNNEILAADAQAAFASAAASGNFLPREYPVAADGEDGYVVQTYFFPYPDFPDGPRVAVFFRDSMWRRLWERFRPNVRQADSSHFTTNSLGWRDGEVALPKPPGTVRIVCIGGSTTVEGPHNDLTYPKMLERMLREALGTARVEVVNAGVYGHTLPTQNRIAADYLELDPDLIVHYNYVNDIIQHLPAWASPHAAIDSPWDALRFLLRRSRFLYCCRNRMLLPGDDALRAHMDRVIIRELRVLREKLPEHVGLAVCSFAYPDPEALAPAERLFYDFHINNMQWGRLVDIASYAHVTALFNELVRRFCAETGSLYVPVAEAFTGAGGAVFTDICHMGPHGMERKARAVFEAIRPWVENKLAERAGG